MNNKTKQGMMNRFLVNDLPNTPSSTPLSTIRPAKSLSGMDVLNKAMEVLGTDVAPVLVDIVSIGFDSKNKRALSPAEFHRLKASIESDGLFNPITVRKSDDPQFLYMVVAGHNRLQAMKELGHQSVPVNVVNLKDDGTKAAFVSNLLQPELGIAEVFEGLKILRAGEGEQKSVRQLAVETGFSAAYISQVLSMEKLPSELVLAMKRARVRVGSNVIKRFVELLSETKGAKYSKAIQNAIEMIDNTFSEVTSLSPTLSKDEKLATGAGEDAALKSWQKALTSFVSTYSAKEAVPSPARPRKVDLKGWSFSGAVRRKNSVVLSFEDEAEAEQFLKQFERSRAV